MERCTCAHMKGTHLKEGKCVGYRCDCTEYSPIEYVGESSVVKSQNRQNTSEEIPADEFSTSVAVIMKAEDFNQAQQKVSDFCIQKLKEFNREIRDLRENLQTAKKNNWRTRPIASALVRCQNRRKFYAKIKAATDAGYMIIPDFPIRPFAVRATRDSVSGLPAKYESEIKRVESNSPEIGEGKYVSNRPETISVEVTNKAGNKEWWQKPESFGEVAFPVAFAKPHILSATAKAMDLKIFDEIGVVGERPKKDPIIVGSILLRQGYPTKRINFFIAWWLNIEDL